MNKKAVTFQVLMKMVLYAVAIGMVLFATPMILNAASDTAQDSACRTSVIARGNFVVDFKLRVPSTSITVARANYERIVPIICNERPIGLIEAPKVDDLSDREYVKSQIAYLMGSCWEQFAEGRVKQLFLEESNRDYYCHVCSSFRIPRDMNNGTSHQINYTELEYLNEVREPDFILAEEMYAYLRQTPSSFPRFTSMRDHYFGLAVTMEDLHHRYFDIESDYMNLRAVGNSASHRQTLAEESVLILSNEEILSSQTKSKIAEMGQKLILNNRGSLAVIIGDNTLRTRADARNLIERMGLNSEGRYDAILILIDIKSGTMRIHLGKEHGAYLTEYDVNQILTQEFQTVSNLNLNSNNGLDQSLYNFLERLDTILFPQVDQDWQEIQGSYLAYLAGNTQESFPLISHINASNSYVVAYLSNEQSNFWLSATRSNILGNLPLAAALVCFIPGFGWGACGVGLVIAGTSGYALNSAESYMEQQAKDFLSSLSNQIVVMPSNELRNVCGVVS